MLNSKSFLAVDFGASNLKLAEFEIAEDGGLLLKNYCFKSLGQEGAMEAAREGVMLKAMQEVMAEQPFKARNVSVCAPGFHTFSKFVKLPPVDTSKVTQIIQYEAQQNVPFPLEEVVWDYQILGATATGELEVLLVAIKSDMVEGLSKVAESSGLRLQLVEVSPAALCNAFRYNYPDLEGCSMLLDIGAKTSNLLFFEKGNVYSRSISIGANSITQDFSKEARLNFSEAERLKIEEGFVSLGGAYEEPENPQQAAISKIARQVMTRLHIQVNQTIQFYRGQQGGSAPVRLFLSGGASIMPYTAQFFSEKLNLPEEGVQYFNPLRSVAIDPSVNREELAKVAHSLGEVIGLGLRNLAHCPVELNLMPPSYQKKQELNRRKPYFAAAALCLVLIFFASGWFYKKVAQQKQDALTKIESRLNPLVTNNQKIKDETGRLNGVKAQAQQYVTWLEDRYYWPQLLSEIRQVLMQVEQDQEKAFGAKTGIWIEKMTPIAVSSLKGPWLTETNKPATTPAATGTSRGGAQRSSSSTQRTTTSASTIANSVNGEIVSVEIQCRAVNMEKAGADANTKMAFALQAALATRTNLFEATNGVVPSGTLTTTVDGMTVGIDFVLKLKRPLKL
jgi:type IV pilus assembly protein PilM